MSDEHCKFQRLFTDQPLKKDGTITLTAPQAHYLGNVLRKKPDDKLRLFNTQDGEWFATIETISKKSGTLKPTKQIRTQSANETPIHLLFAPLKKNRMDFIIEKCTELGITDFHPIMTNRTEIKMLKRDRIEAQIIEACEQSERLSIPKLHDITPLTKKIAQWKITPQIYAGLERADAPHINTLPSSKSYAFLIGPVGGFDQKEHETLMEQPKITPISLGENILRAETACILCATWVLLK